MAFVDKLKRGEPTLSFEFFPPKSTEGWTMLYSTLAALTPLYPDYVSVTYGAGGSTREKTVELVARIQRELAIESMAHLTCVGHSKVELHKILEDLRAGGVENVLALRGDPPKGDTTFNPHPDGFSHATELLEFIKRDFSFQLGCAFYPEKHLEAVDLDSDIEYLKMKQDKGADFSISQLFFDNRSYFEFREKAAVKGVTFPLIAGIMPVTAISQLERFKKMCGAIIPPGLTSFLAKSPDVATYGIDYAFAQCEELLREGTPGIHLYTLNKSNSSVSITKKLREKGWFQTAVKP